MSAEQTPPFQMTDTVESILNTQEESLRRAAKRAYVLSWSNLLIYYLRNPEAMNNAIQSGFYGRVWQNFVAATTRPLSSFATNT